MIGRHISKIKAKYVAYNRAMYCLTKVGVSSHVPWINVYKWEEISATEIVIIRSQDKPDIYQAPFQKCLKQFSKGHLAPAKYHHSRGAEWDELVRILTEHLRHPIYDATQTARVIQPSQRSSSSVSSSPMRSPGWRSSPGLRAQERPSVYGSTRKGKSSV